MQEIRCYIRREFSKQLNVTSIGVAMHDPCIGHCLCNAFGNCDQQHSMICSGCESFFKIFDKLKKALRLDLHNSIEEYQTKLINWMAHLARKTYLNVHVQVNLNNLDNNGAVIIVDFKMKILLQHSRETKKDFYGKHGWSLHSVLVYTKDITKNQLNLEVYDHWSDNSKQDAWFTASSLYTVFETMRISLNG